jgi:autotransporter family porin
MGLFFLLALPLSLAAAQLADPERPSDSLFFFLPLIAAPGTPEPAHTPTPTVGPTPSATPTAPPNPQYFETLPPGAVLPEEAYCATAVKPRPENKGLNQPYNNTLGSQGIAPDFFTPGSGDPRANTEIGVRVSGNFTGTTDEILQWAACKWGVDEDLVRAQAAIESWWHQDAMGDWGTDPSRCPPGHGLGVDGRPGECPESWGILQNRYPYEPSGWPGFGDSTAFNADLTYAIWRACFEGYEWWLNHVERGEEYAAGDAWGCVGRWYSGRWHTSAAEEYIQRVQGYLNDRIWEEAYFQEP